MSNLIWRYLKLSVLISVSFLGLETVCPAAITINTTWTAQSSSRPTQVDTVWSAVIDYYTNTFAQSYAGETWNITVSWENIGTTSVANAGPEGAWTSGATLLGLGANAGRVIAGASYSSTLANHLAKSTIVSGQNITLNLNSNSFITWDYSTTSKGPGTESLYTTAIHEIGHGLGFLSLLDSSTGAYYNDEPSIFDFYLSQGGTPLVGMTDSERLGATTSSNVIWTGANGQAAQGGAFKIYAPTAYEDGSSMSHIDFSANSSESLIMFPSDSASPSNFSYSETELGMWKDLGYDIVPEPASVVLLLMAGGGWLVFLSFRAQARSACRLCRAQIDK